MTHRTRNTASERGQAEGSDKNRRNNFPAFTSGVYARMSTVMSVVRAGQRIDETSWKNILKFSSKEQLRICRVQ